MNRLLKVELTRLSWRKLPVVALLAILAIVVLSLTAVHLQARTAAPGSEQYEMMKSEYEAYVADYEENGEQYRADCLEQQDQEREATGDQTLDFGCDADQIGTLQDWIGGPGDLQPETGSLLDGLTTVFLLISLLVGASATAAEYSHRTMGTWLTFEPRRTMVYVSKVAAAALVAAPAAILGMALAVLGMFAVYQLNGLPTSLTSAEWQSLLWRGVRLAWLAAVSAAFGAALGTLLRRTSVVLGLVLIYTVVGETLISGILPALTPALLGSNIRAFAQNGWTWFTYPCEGGGACREVEHVLSLSQASVYLGALSAVVLVGTWVVFRRRDVE
ncbi:MAG: ABC transporter permease subunit [Ornithinimicrobium sp.]